MAKKYEELTIVDDFMYEKVTHDLGIMKELMETRQYNGKAGKFSEVYGNWRSDG